MSFSLSLSHISSKRHIESGITQKKQVRRNAHNRVVDGRIFRRARDAMLNMSRFFCEHSSVLFAILRSSFSSNIIFQLLFRVLNLLLNSKSGNKKVEKSNLTCTRNLFTVFHCDFFSMEYEVLSKYERIYRFEYCTSIEYL